MKAKWIYIIAFYLLGIFSISLTVQRKDKQHVVSRSIIAKSPTTNSEKPFKGDSPLIRFHSATNVSGVSISSPNVLVISQKHENSTPEKFAGITEYFSSLPYILPVTREFLYSTPLRSPPLC